MSSRPRSKPYRLKPPQLRWRCKPAVFDFTTTKDLAKCPINIIGQPRALEAVELGLSVRAVGYNIFLSGHVGCGRSTVVRRTLARLDRGESPPDDLVYVHDFHDPDQPSRLTFPAGRGVAFRDAMDELVRSLRNDLPQLFESEPYAKRRNAMREEVANKQKGRLKTFETHVGGQGFALVQVQIGPAIAPTLLPVVAGNPTEMEKLEGLVEQEQFKQEELEALQKRLSALRTEMESVAKELRDMDRDLQHRLTTLDRELAAPLVAEGVGWLRAAFDSEGLKPYLEELAKDLLDSLDEFREREESDSEHPHTREEVPSRYHANVVVDNGRTKGRPIIWETAPSYRNLFGTIDMVRSQAGEWGTDHTKIKAGSLLRANGGIIVLDAMDVLVEPGVWAALKRTLRTRRVEIQAFDPMHMLAGVSLKPEASPIDVKVVMIGTPHIYRLLYHVDEDFKKVFKVKADFAVQTPLSDDELENYACFVHKKVTDDELPHFHRTAVAAVVEEGVRIAGHRNKLTTRFKDIADLIRESAYWATKRSARYVRAEHVDEAVAKQAYRVDLIEETLRERITEGTVLIDLAGRKVGQANALAVLDVGDHAFAQPARITAVTSVGRAGIVAIDREAKMAGAIHNKGVLILSGFLRGRFAQEQPLTLTASLAFEQNYGGIDGDSASSTELYALLSALSGVPLDQGIAVTGSVNQNGEVQPIGGANEKIEGFFDLCTAMGLTGKQGVMIPERNLPQLMLRKDVVAAVRARRFHIYAVSTIEEGLETLTGVAAGVPGEDGTYPADTIFGRADAELRRLAEAGKPSKPGSADRNGKSESKASARKSAGKPAPAKTPAKTPVRKPARRKPARRKRAPARR